VRCRHCGTKIPPWECERCHKEIADQCRLCHDELVHDIIVPQFMRPQFGGGRYGPTDDTSPAWDNGVNTLEGGL